MGPESFLWNPLDGLKTIQALKNINEARFKKRIDVTCIPAGGVEEVRGESLCVVSSSLCAVEDSLRGDFMAVSSVESLTGDLEYPSSASLSSVFRFSPLGVGI